MRKARLGLQGIEQEAERLRTLLNVSLHVELDNLGGTDFTTSTTGSWEDTGLSLTITPTRDVRCLALFRGVVKHSVAQISLRYRIYESSAMDTRGMWQELSQTADSWVPVILFGLCDLAAGTSYTFKVQSYFTAAGTFTLAGNVLFTKLALILAQKAVLA